VHSAIRLLTAWVLTLSLFSGSFAAYTAVPTADADGACGPVIALAHSTDHFEVARPALSDHCALCHLWNAMASASVSDGALIAPPDVDFTERLRPSSDRGDLIVLGEASPRGPPARS
jgi:uncharacterized membrane protein